MSISSTLTMCASVFVTQRAAAFCRFSPGVQQSGASAGRAGQVDGQVSPAVVGQGEPGLDVLQ